MEEIKKDTPKKRRIFAGYYKRYDGGLHFYVIRVVSDLITGEDVILCRKDSFNDFSYFVLSRKEFDTKVNCGGKKIKKYYRNTRQNPISDKALEDIEMDGFPTTIRRTYKEDKMHHTRMSRTYEEYAKELLEWYKHDLEACMLTKKTGKIVGMASVEDYPIIVEDVKFLNQCFKTTLKDFLPFFQERFMEGKSIRKYAEDHNINRGSVEYQQKRLIVALSNLLFDRDAVEGVCRVDYSWLKQ